jgi:hypothetical protein
MDNHALCSEDRLAMPKGSERRYTMALGQRHQFRSQIRTETEDCPRGEGSATQDLQAVDSASPAGPVTSHKTLPRHDLSRQEFESADLSGPPSPPLRPRSPPNRLGWVPYPHTWRKSYESDAS